MGESSGMSKLFNKNDIDYDEACIYVLERLIKQFGYQETVRLVEVGEEDKKQSRPLDKPTCSELLKALMTMCPAATMKQLLASLLNKSHMKKYLPSPDQRVP